MTCEGDDTIERFTLPGGQDIHFDGDRWVLWEPPDGSTVTHHISLAEAFRACGRGDLAGILERDKKNQ